MKNWISRTLLGVFVVPLVWLVVPVFSTTTNKIMKLPSKKVDESQLIQAKKDAAPIPAPSSNGAATAVALASNALPIVLSLPEYGDMDVPGKQLLDGSMHCIGKMRTQMAKAEQRFALLGNNNLVDEDGVAQLVEFMKQARLIIGAMGAENLLHLYAHPQMQKALYFFPIEGSQAVRSKNNPATIFYRPSYTAELKALVEYAAKTKLKERFAILYEAGLWGSSLYEELLKIFEEYRIKPVAVARYQQNTVEVKRAIKNIGNAAPSAIFCLAKPRPTYKFVTEALDEGMHTTLFLGLSPLISVQHLLKKARGVDLVCISVVPPESSNIELVKKYKEFFSDRFDFKRSNPLFLESFLYANLLVDALKNVPGAVQKPELLIQYFEQFKNKDFMGLPLTFDPVTRGLATKIWVSPGGEKPWIEAGCAASKLVKL